MFKGNSFILIFAMLVVVFLLFVSDTPSWVKFLLFIMTVAFFIPVIRHTVYKDRYRKIKAAFFTSVIFTIGLYIFTVIMSIVEEDQYVVEGEVLQFMIVVYFFSLIGNFLYGLPASMIAEFVSMKFSPFRFWLSGLIHIGLGAITYFILPGFSIPAVCCSVIFFTLDERIRKDY
jgi:hypothetical protein